MSKNGEDGRARRNDSEERQNRAAGVRLQWAHQVGLRQKEWGDGEGGVRSKVKSLRHCEKYDGKSGGDDECEQRTDEEGGFNPRVGCGGAPRDAARKQKSARQDPARSKGHGMKEIEVLK